MIRHPLRPPTSNAATAVQPRGGLEVLVVGGGIGGCAAALALHQAGVKDVRIFEAVARIQPLGVGINLQASGVLALHELGLKEQLEATAIKTRKLNYYTGEDGREIISDPRGQYAGYKVPQYSIHRGHLQMILLNAAKETIGVERVVVGHRLQSFEQHGGKVHATFELLDGKMQPTGDTATHVCDVLIGCDGIKSVVRQQLYPEDQIQYSGLMLWRATTLLERPFMGGDTMFMAGTNQAKLVAYPISREAADEGASLVNWIAESWVRDYDPESFGYSVEASKSDFAHLFADWQGGFWSPEAVARGEGLDIPALIDGAETVFAYPMVDRDPLPRWSFGGVSLLGDAAHAMRPNGSNGATQAILDGVALAARLATAQATVLQAPSAANRGRAATVEAALQAYETERLEPTKAVVLANRGTGPEKVLQMAHDDPDVPKPLLDGVLARYRQLAGFDAQQVNARYEAWQAELQGQEGCVQHGKVAGGTAEQGSHGVGGGGGAAVAAMPLFQPYNQRRQDEVGLTELKFEPEAADPARNTGAFTLRQEPATLRGGSDQPRVLAGTYVRQGANAFVFTAVPSTGDEDTATAIFRARASGTDADDYVLEFEPGAPIVLGGAHWRLPCLGAPGSSMNY